MSHEVLTLYEYHVWANKRIFEHLKGLPQDLFHRPIPNVFPTIAETFAHIYIVDRLWLGVMATGDPTDEILAIVKKVEEETKGLEREEMKIRYNQLSQEYRTFFNGVEGFDQPVSIKHPRLGRFETRLSELVKHVVNHGTYHRGNITSMLRQTGHPGVSTDYVFYLYQLQKQSH
ncbi:DinB family protein [Salinithrix halophila]|uniref:DinB family protein n=1 Tax=Salinithrix halophila TaxID=1485204 RepID=A0ABV8JDX0_9BACL